MTHAFVQLLDQKGTLLADGATGTNLFNMGLTAGDAPELWNRDAPDKIRALYRGAVDAGCDLFLTNSFGANAARLKLHDAADQVFEISRRAAELGREVADSAGRAVLVAGSMGPTGEILAPLGPLSEQSAAEMFEATAAGLKAGGADLAWVETISAEAEFRAASVGLARAGLHWCGTMSFDTAGRTMMGVTAARMAEMVETLEHPPMAFGANCGVGASDLVRTVRGFSPSSRPIIAKGNAGIPKYVDGHIHYDGTPELMATYAQLARAAGARIIGGCCGTTPDHLRLMRAALDGAEDRAAPDLEEIEAKLGPFTMPTSDADPQSSRPRRRRARG